MQTAIREQAQDIKNRLENVQSLQTTVHEEAKDFKDQLGEMHRSIDRLSSSAAGSQSDGGGLKCIFLNMVTFNRSKCREGVSNVNQ